MAVEIKQRSGSCYQCLAFQFAFGETKAACKLGHAIRPLEGIVRWPTEPCERPVNCRDLEESLRMYSERTDKSS